MEPPNNEHIGSRTFISVSEVVLISEGATELYFTAILSYNIDVINTTAIIACYIIVISVIKYVYIHV